VFLAGGRQLEQEQLRAAVHRYCYVEFVVVRLGVLARLVKVERRHVHVKRQNARGTRERGHQLIAAVYVPDSDGPVVADRVIREEEVVVLALVLGEHFNFVYRISIRVQCASSKLKIDKLVIKSKIMKH
jgi:hypothetical protein